MSYSFLDPWHDFLPRDGGHVLGIMGSGGKTSLMLALANLYSQWKIPVILTTTTQCENLPDISRYEHRALAEEIANGVDLGDLPSSFFLDDGFNAEGKLVGITPEKVDELGEWFPDRVILVEVDGSAKLPIKIHKDGEPVWPQRTSLAFVVMGVSAVGEPVGDVVHRFGRQPCKPLEEVKEWENLEWSHLQKMLLDDGGYLEQVPSGVPAMLVLTGMDVQDDSIGLFSFVGQAMENQRLPIVAFCDFGTENGEIRVACHLADEDSNFEAPAND